MTPQRRQTIGRLGDRHALRAILLALVVLLSTATVTVVATHSDHEPNDSQSSAASITAGTLDQTELGTAFSLTGNPNDNGDYDEDWYEFTAQGTTFQVTLESDPTEMGDVGFDVYDAEGTVVGSNNTGKPVADSGEPASLEEVNAADTDGDGDLETSVTVTEATDGATYYVRVFAHDDPTNDSTHAAQECGLESDGDRECDGRYTLGLSFPPTADAAVNESATQSMNAGSSITFDGTNTTDPDDAVGSLEFTWEFGDGSSQSGTGLTAPSHAYDAPGTYTVTLTVTDPAGGTDTATTTVEVSERPSGGNGGSAPDAHATVEDTRSLSSSAYPEDTPLDFDATMSTGSIESYEWAFDDGTTAHGDFVTHAFEDPGTYEVTLYTNGSAGTDSLTLAVTVTDTTPPTARTGGDRTVRAGTSVTFDAGQSTDNGVVNSYEWSFGDGGSPTGETVSHTFDEAGTYEATLTVTDGGGNSDTATATVTVRPPDEMPPTARAGGDRNVTIGTPVTFDASNSTDNARISNYTWVVDDVPDPTLSGPTATRTFAHPGEYVVELRVTDASGNVGTDRFTVTVHDRTPPTARAGPDRTVNVGDPIAFNASNATDNGVVDGYRWGVMDGNATTLTTLRGVSPEHAIASPGDYTVVLTVTDEGRNTANTTVNVTVEDETAPLARAGPNRTVEVGEAVEFDAANSTDNVGIERYVWGFGDATVDNGTSVTNAYNETGTYLAVLTVFDAAGNRDTAFVPITVTNSTAQASSTSRR